MPANNGSRDRRVEDDWIRHRSVVSWTFLGNKNWVQIKSTTRRGSTVGQTPGSMADRVTGAWLVIDYRMVIKRMWRASLAKKSYLMTRYKAREGHRSVVRWYFNDIRGEVAGKEWGWVRERRRFAERINVEKHLWERKGWMASWRESSFAPYIGHEVTSNPRKKSHTFQWTFF